MGGWASVCRSTFIAAQGHNADPFKNSNTSDNPNLDPNNGLSFALGVAQEDSPKVGAAVGVVIARLMQLSMGDGDGLPFTVVLDDPSGNSFVENLCAPQRDPQLLVSLGFLVLVFSG